MSRRNENVRKALKEIDQIAEFIFKIADEVPTKQAVQLRRYWAMITDLTHRIKRTTWRGESKSKWNKDWDKYNNAKRINTNQTTTANIDVSTIPYY